MRLVQSVASGAAVPAGSLAELPWTGDRTVRAYGPYRTTRAPSRRLRTAQRSLREPDPARQPGRGHDLVVPGARDAGRSVPGCDGVLPVGDRASGADRARSGRAAQAWPTCGPTADASRAGRCVP